MTITLSLIGCNSRGVSSDGSICIITYEQRYTEKLSEFNALTSLLSSLLDEQATATETTQDKINDKIDVVLQRISLLDAELLQIAEALTPLQQVQ